MSWPLATRVQIDLIVDRAQFTVGGVEPIQIVNDQRFQSLTIEKFQEIQLYPEALEVANPDSPLPEPSLPNQEVPLSGWKPLTIQQRPIVITSEAPSLQPAVTLDFPSTGSQALGTLKRVWVNPGATMTVEIRGERVKDISVSVEGQPSSAEVSIPNPFHLITEFGTLSGVTGNPYRGDSFTYRVQPGHNPQITTTSMPEDLVLILSLPNDRTETRILRGPVLVTAIKFLRQNSATGQPESALKAQGSITYVEYPSIDPVTFQPPDFIGIGDFESTLAIEEMKLDSATNGLRFRLTGAPNYLKSGSQVFKTDHRLTRFDALWHNNRLAALVIIIASAFSAMVGVYQFRKEFRE